MLKTGTKPPTLQVSASTSEEARALLTAGQYKKALEVYKLLWKQQPCDEYREALRDGYLGRVQELAEKGMYKEAAMLWENHSVYCINCGHHHDYIRLLLAANLFSKAADVYRKVEKVLPEHDVVYFEEIFAALLFSGNSAIEKLFPVEQPLRKHLILINQALSYCKQQDMSSAEKHLALIPFRSPYKYLRQILKAYLMIETDPGAAEIFLQRVPATSPFYRVAQIMMAALADPIELSKRLPAFSETESAFVSLLRGLSSGSQKIINKLQKTGKAVKDSALFELIVQNRDSLGKTNARRLCYQLLPAVNSKLFEKAFGVLTKWERRHVQALEQMAVEDCAHCVWVDYEEWLAERAPDDPQIKLQRAIVLREAAKIHLHKVMQDKSDDGYQELLQDSLELDPMDKATYLELLGSFDADDVELEEYDHCLSQALQFFPQDRDILDLAINLYRRQQDFDQALLCAEKLLSSDPLNVSVVHRRLEIQLQQAQFLFCKKKTAQARQLLLTAMQSPPVITEFLPALQFNQVLFDYAEKKFAQARSLLQQIVPRVAEDFMLRLRLLLEAAKLQLALSELENALQLPAISRLIIQDSAEFIRVLQLIEGEQKNKALVLDTVFRLLEKPLKLAARHRCSKTELNTIGEYLTCLKQYALIEYFCKEQFKHFPQLPLLIYYRINAKVKGNPQKVSDKDFNLLDATFDRAKINDDERAMMLISQFLTSAAQHRYSASPFFEGMPPVPKSLMDKIIQMMELDEEEFDEGELDEDSYYDNADFFLDPPGKKPAKKRKKSISSKPKQGELF